MKTCTCGTPNAPGAKFCGNCGRNFASSAHLVACNCGAMIAKSAKACPQCGKNYSQQSGWAVIFGVGLPVLGFLLIMYSCSQVPEPSTYSKDMDRASGMRVDEPTAPAKAKAKPTGKEVAASLVRVAECKQLQDGFTQESIAADVKITNDDLSGLIIIGPAVDHLFVRQFLAGSVGRKGLKRSGFKEVEFLKSDYTPVAQYYPLTNQLTLDGN